MALLFCFFMFSFWDFWFLKASPFFFVFFMVYFYCRKCDYMKKNGFTLIEILGVVAILAILGLIVIPVINNIISNKKVELYNVQIKNIESGASNYISEHIFEVDIPLGSSKGITLGRLKSGGYLEDNIINPITNVSFDDSTVIMVTNTSSGFVYTVCVNVTACDVSGEL